MRSDDPREGDSLADRLRAWGPAIAWAGVLFFLSALPSLGGVPSFPYSDKIAHAGLYAVLGGALAWGRSRSPGAVPHAILLAAGAVYGLTDEWHQMFVPGRVPDAADWIADLVGLVIGYGLVIRRVGPANANEELEGRNDV